MSRCSRPRRQSGTAVNRTLVSASTICPTRVGVSNRCTNHHPHVPARPSDGGELCIHACPVERFLPAGRRETRDKSWGLMRKWGGLGRSGTHTRHDDGSSDGDGMGEILINDCVSRGPSLRAASSGAGDGRKEREGPLRKSCPALYHPAPWCQEKCVACLRRR